jgi:intracellular septation protein A
MKSLTGTLAHPVARTAAEPLPERPSLGSILGRLVVSLAVAVVVPGVIFYVALVASGVTTAVLLALAWASGAIVWRRATGRAMSGLLVLTVAVMAARTAFTLATGNTFIYFFQPVITDGAVGTLFLVSVATARPLVARMAADFYPMNDDVAARPRIRRLFRYLTLMWAFVILAKGAVTLYLLESQSMVSFVLFKNLAMLALTIGAVAVTIAAAMQVARKESLLAPA